MMNSEHKWSWASEGNDQVINDTDQDSWPWLQMLLRAKTTCWYNTCMKCQLGGLGAGPQENFEFYSIRDCFLCNHTWITPPNLATVPNVYTINDHNIGPVVAVPSCMACVMQLNGVCISMWLLILCCDSFTLLWEFVQSEATMLG